MQALNHKERKKAIWKFIGINSFVVILTTLSMYSFVWINQDIQWRSLNMKNGETKFVEFIHQTNNLISQLEKADSKTKRIELVTKLQKSLNNMEFTIPESHLVEQEMIKLYRASLSDKEKNRLALEEWEEEKQVLTQEFETEKQELLQNFETEKQDLALLHQTEKGMLEGKLDRAEQARDRNRRNQQKPLTIQRSVPSKSDGKELTKCQNEFYTYKTVMSNTINHFTRRLRAQIANVRDVHHELSARKNKNERLRLTSVEVALRNLAKDMDRE